MLVEFKNIKRTINLAVLGTAVVLVSGCTTLHTAAAKGNLKAIDRLVNEGDDINAFDDEGITPLIQAVKKNQLSSVNALLKSGANINMSDDIKNNTPLHYAIRQGNSKLVALLIANGADILIQNNDMQTPLDLAHASNSEEIRKSLDIANQKLLAKQQVVIQKPKIETPLVEKTEPIKKEMEEVLEVAKLSAVKTTTVTQVATSAVTVSNSVPADAAETLKGMISRHETRGIRGYLNKYPQAVYLIEDSKQQIRYIGPSDWRVIDIVEKIEKDKVQESVLIDYITKNTLVYKKFTKDELAILLRYGLSNKLINVMMQAD